MSRKSVIMCVLSALMVVYIAFALPINSAMSNAETMGRLRIVLTEPSQFVDSADVRRALGIDEALLPYTNRRTFELNKLENKLKASDKLQHAEANILANGDLKIVVTPMIPVARVFDPSHPSYYINAQGKKISADLRYHLDVPVLVGSFDSIYPAHRLLPLLDYIASRPKVNALVATVTQEPTGNIIIVPTIVGHVINFGDTSMVNDKFLRLRAFYRHVAPAQGWNLYDTIAVKWSGRIVATQRNKALEAPALPTEDDMSGALDIDGNEPLPDEDQHMAAGNKDSVKTSLN